MDARALRSTKSGSRRFFMLIGAAHSAPPPAGECDPYVKPDHMAANINLITVLAPLSSSAMNVNLCEHMT